ncbi:MAG TPA: CBS domain-containing protein [Polyangiaceae bacterium]
MTTRPTLVRDIMTKEVVTLAFDDKLAVADDVMRLGRIRHLPVIDAQGLLAGIVSQRDLFQSGLLRAMGVDGATQRRAFDAVSIREAMKPDVVTVAPDTSLEVAARLMLERKIGCLLVTEGKRILGIVTESDFVKLALPRGAR